MHCPHCSRQLERETYHRKILFRCSGCQGQFVTVSALRGLSRSKEFVNKLWLHAAHSKAPGVPCPDCGRTMVRVLLYPTQETALELDVCKDCHAVWFDPEELEAIPLPEEPKDDLPPEAKKILAMRRIERIEKMSRQGGPADAPDACWKLIPVLLGMPVEQESPPLARLPLLTWSLTALCCLLFLISLKELRTVLSVWGFIPAEWYRFSGITLLSSMFLHANFAHLAGNMYFLLTFGDNVEDEFGRVKYLLLILFSGLFATFTHLLTHPGSTIPCIGASGFISGIIACYAVLFPRVKICIFIARVFLVRGLINLPAWGAFVLWMLFQITMAALATPGTGGTAYSAHLGGAIAGLAAALACRFIHTRRSEKTKAC